MVGCAAYGCKTNSRRKPHGVTFHRFPKDPQKRDAWTNNMKMANWEASDNVRICSKHFEERFLYRTNDKVLLLNGAIPTIFPELPKHLQPKTNTEPEQICAVAFCKSNTKRMRKKGTQITFHLFPHREDLVSSRLRKEWIRRCGQNKFNPNTAAICSIHFTEEDFERDVENELLGLPERRILKKTAIPTLNLTETSGGSLEESPKETPCARRNERGKNLGKNKELVDSPSQENDMNEGLSDSESSDVPVHSSSEESDMNADLSESDSLEIPNTSAYVPLYTSSILRNKNPSVSSSPWPDYKRKYEDLLLKYNYFKSDSKSKIKRLQKKLRYYDTKFQLLSLNKNTTSLKAEHFLEEC